jgi:hypothetical protein
MKPMQLTIVALTTLLLSSVLWSCNKDRASSELAETRSTQEQPSTPSMPSGMPGTGGGMMDQLRAGCPMVVQGADVTAADTDGGVALTFTTDAGDVGELRTRVRSMAQMYGMHRGQGGMMWHHMGGKGMGHGGRGMGAAGMGHMAGRGPMPAASDTVTDTDQGARLELRPTDPAQLDDLREHVRWHQQRMHSGECWMPQEQPHEGTP